MINILFCLTEEGKNRNFYFSPISVVLWCLIFNYELLEATAIFSAIFMELLAYRSLDH